MKKPLLIFIFFLFVFFNSRGQNLVPNGDFEQYSSCPTGEGQLDSALFWTNPAVWNGPGSPGGSPDYFNQCSPIIYQSVPQNYLGFQPAHSGVAYCGLVTGNTGFGVNNWREFAEVPLTTSLSASVCYYFQMHINLANYCQYTTDRIGVYFSDFLINGIANFYPLPFTPQIDINFGFINDTINWIHITGNYTATGGEKYLIIGNFKDSSQTNMVLINAGGFVGYTLFYIDDVSLTPCTAIEEQNQNEAIKIYPNPVKDELRVSGLKFLVGEKATMKIFDVLGKAAQPETRNVKPETKINVSTLKRGIYFLEINDGKNIYRKKFLKE